MRGLLQTSVELAMLADPVLGPHLHRIAGVQAFQRQCFEFVFGVLVSAHQELDIGFHRDPLGLGTGTQRGFEFGTNAHIHNPDSTIPAEGSTWRKEAISRLAKPNPNLTADYADDADWEKDCAS